MKELLDAFRALRGAPRGFWLVLFAFSVDAMAYFGALTLMHEFLHQDLGIRDVWAGPIVSCFTGAVTLFMLWPGGRAERRGVRRGVLWALAACLVGRAVTAAAPLFAGGGGAAAAASSPSAARLLALGLGLGLVALGEGVLQPVAYAGVKRFTDAKTSAMGYALLYAAMNLTIVIMGVVSPLVRVPQEARHAAGASPISGVAMVGWTCVGITALCLVVYALASRGEREDGAPGGPPELTSAAAPAAPAAPPGTSPLRDTRFLFFVFVLLPVRTLFAHQWLTLPTYVLRAYPAGVADRMEWIVNWINPGVIFFGVPIVTALTKKYPVYRMMILGTLVSALPTFLLCLGPTLTNLVTYLVVFSIGEALWSSRFLEYTAELAPEGRVAAYMGVANFPWFLAKTTTGLYSGAMLEAFCPEGGPQRTEILWTVYGLVALATPVGLVLGKSWVERGAAPSAAAASATP